MSYKKILLLMVSLSLVACQNNALLGPFGSPGDGSNDGVGDPDPITPPSKKLEVINGEFDAESVLLSSFRYREVFPDYSAGQASIVSSDLESFALAEEDISVSVRVEADHLAAMGGEIKIRASQQIWANLEYQEPDRETSTKICILIQPKNFTINSAGDHDIPLIKKQVHTFLEGQHDCSNIGSLPAEIVESGITRSPFKVQSEVPMVATTQNDFKSNKKRVGVVVEFDIHRGI